VNCTREAVFVRGREEIAAIGITEPLLPRRTPAETLDRLLDDAV
jgi:hypothetical protein